MLKIFIEAESLNVPESKFLETILNSLGIAKDRYELMPIGGYTNLMDSASTSNIEMMRANTDDGGINLVIFDADEEKNNGGYQKRRKELLTKRDNLGLKFELFLWPDNRSDGDVEVLMEEIARKDLYRDLFDCYSRYELCISKRKAEDGKPYYNLPNRKNKLHTYFTALPISRSKRDKAGRGNWLWSDAEIWDLDAAAMQPIKDFLIKYIN